MHNEKPQTSIDVELRIPLTQFKQFVDSFGSSGGVGDHTFVLTSVVHVE
jgi:hypothetical protein